MADQQPPQQPPAQQEDMLDKAVDKAEVAVGKKTGHEVDPQKFRKQNESFTDKLRGMFEKFTGKKAPAKVSN